VRYLHQLTASKMLLAMYAVLPTFLACATTSSYPGKEAQYSSCIHDALQGVHDGWICHYDEWIRGAQFQGHAVCQSALGIISPISDLAIWRASAREYEARGWKERLDVEIGSDGWFTVPQDVRISNTVAMQNGKLSVSQVMEDYVFILSAPGCEDYVVHYRPDDPAHIILMHCPARAEDDATHVH